MFEQGLLRTGGIKLFGSGFLGLTLVALSGVLIWRLWRDRQAFQNLHVKNMAHKYEEKLSNVKMRLEALSAEQNELTIQVVQLRENLSHFQSSVNEVSKKAAATDNKQEPDAAKLTMLKKIMEDNVKIRQSL